MEKESQRRNSTAPGKGTVSSKRTHRSSEVKFRAHSQLPPGGKEAAVNACLPACSPSPPRLNTSPAPAPLPGRPRDLRGYPRPRHSGSGLTDTALPPRGAEGTQVRHSTSNGALACFVFALQRRGAQALLFKTFVHSSSNVALSSSLTASPPPGTLDSFFLSTLALLTVFTPKPLSSQLLL